MENFQPVQPSVGLQPARPVFLTVLCILTFIGSGWGIISGVSSYLTANTTSDVAQAAMQDAKDNIEDELSSSNTGSKLAEKMFSGVSEMLQPENIKKNSMFSIVAAVFTLLGAIMMFGLKKIGFYSYLLGTLIGIAGPFIVFGGGNFLAILSSSIMAFIGIIFVILYALNLKYLR